MASPPQLPVAPDAPPTPVLSRALLNRVPAGPIRRFLSTHEVHILPHRVSHSRRARRALVVIAVAALVFAAWWWVIPRTDITVKAQYHEGLFNAIAVDMKVINSGTTALSPLHVEMVVTDEANHSSMGFFALNTSLAPHRSLEANAIQFKGDELATNYTISILVSYDSGAGRVVKTLDFRTEEPYMNLYFEGRVA